MNALNVPHVPRPHFIAPQMIAFKSKAIHGKIYVQKNSEGTVMTNRGRKGRVGVMVYPLTNKKLMLKLYFETT